MIRRVLKLPLLLLIRMYQWCISPMLGCHCRFSPSCSEYAHTAIQRHGVWRGGLYTLNRLCRCQPFASSGYDPVPDAILSTSKFSK